MTKRTLWLFAGVATFSVSCAAFLHHTSTVRVDEIKFPHDRHAKAKVQCITCHEAIYDATTLVGDFRPPEGKCMECHDKEKAQGKCEMCHTDVRYAAAYPKTKPEMRISHTKHIDRVNEDCMRCHVEKTGVATRTMTTLMDNCFSCHEHKEEYAQARCDGCHVDLARYGAKPVASLFSHEGDFVREHAVPARAGAATCAKCHDQTFCADCHAAQTTAMRVELKSPERVDRGFIHRGDFVSRHSLEAKAEPASCKRCHGTSFCDSCHAAENLTPRATNPRDPHPPGFAFPGSPGFHGEAARRNIASCSGCHDQGAQSICVDCHKVGGVGGTPHTAKWTRQHSTNEIHSNGMCVACHP